MTGVSILASCLEIRIAHRKARVGAHITLLIYEVHSLVNQSVPEPHSQLGTDGAGDGVTATGPVRELPRRRAGPDLSSPDHTHLQEAPASAGST